MMDFRKTRLLPRRVTAGACLAAGILGVSLFAGAGTTASEAASLSVTGELLPELVLIPAGEMAVDNPDRRSAGTGDAEPRRVVFERPFLLGKFEITFEQWDQCHRAGGCDHRPDDKGWGRSDRPVIDVSWDDIAQYLDWLSAATGERYRLPTEDEWEYAARAGSPEPVEPPSFFGDEDLAWAEDFLLAFRGTAKTKPVASYESNEFGVVGTKGNVWEWTEDCWQQTYQTDDGPISRENCGIRVLLGEHRSYMPTFVRNTSTGGCSVKPMPANFGFHVVRDS